MAGKTEVVAMQEGDYFGENSLMGGDAPYDSPLHTMTVAAKGTLVCLTVERHAASTLIGSLQERVSQALELQRVRVRVRVRGRGRGRG